jgi:hypothetical protein
MDVPPPSLLIKIPEPALEWSWKKTPLPLLIKVVELPAVAALVKVIYPPPKNGEGPYVTKVCIVPELFTMPVPLIVNASAVPNPGVALLIVKALASGSKVMPLTSMFVEKETLVVVDTSKIAVSEPLFGTVAGVQLMAVFQSPEPGLRSQVALPALTAGATANVVTIRKSAILVFIDWSN